jgi:hypothetical protein
MKVVSEILGHANISITADTYSQVRPAMQEDATTRVAAVVSGRSLFPPAGKAKPLGTSPGGLLAFTAPFRHLGAP